MPRISLLAVFALAALGAATTGCHRSTSDTERQKAVQATAEAEEKAQEGSLTSAAIEPPADEAREAGDEATRARGEVIAAFHLEQADYRGRLQRALDRLDGEVTRARRAGDQRSARSGDLGARRALLKTDLVSVDRSTEQDWATLRTRVERDLETGNPGAQFPPRTDRVPGEAP
jgi:hypothetical protein